MNLLEIRGLISGDKKGSELIKGIKVISEVDNLLILRYHAQIRISAGSKGYRKNKKKV